MPIWCVQVQCNHLDRDLDDFLAPKAINQLASHCHFLIHIGVGLAYVSQYLLQYDP